MRKNQAHQKYKIYITNTKSVLDNLPTRFTVYKKS